MNIETIIKNSLVNFDGKVAIYYDDLHGNILSINEKEIYNAASCIKIFILGLATFGLTSMWVAVFADTGLTLITILNSLRILKR